MTYPATVTPTTAPVDAVYSVQKTCKTGNLYNYGTSAVAPSNAGTATLDNAGNTAHILDYAPIPGAYKELTAFSIANEAGHHARGRDADFLRLEKSLRMAS